jgi:hypothetical protein
MASLKQSSKIFSEFDPILFMNQLKSDDIEKALAQVNNEAIWRIPGAPKYGGKTHYGHQGFCKFAELSNYFLPFGSERLWTRVSHAPGITFLEQKIKAKTCVDTIYINEYVFVFIHGDDGKLIEVKEYQDMVPMHEAFKGWVEKQECTIE